MDLHAFLWIDYYVFVMAAGVATANRWNQPNQMVVSVPCSADEYYDQNVEACSRCSEICRPSIDLTHCIANCPEFFRRNFNVSITATSPAAAAAADGTKEEQLTEKPLFWISVVSMTIACGATLAIIVLCVRRRRSRTAGGMCTRRMMSADDSCAEAGLTKAGSESSDVHGLEDKRSLAAHHHWRESCSSDRNDTDDVTHGREGHIRVTGANETDLCASCYRGDACGPNDFSDLPLTPCPEKVPYSPPELQNVQLGRPVNTPPLRCSQDVNSPMTKALLSFVRTAAGNRKPQSYNSEMEAGQKQRDTKETRLKEALTSDQAVIDGQRRMTTFDRPTKDRPAVVPYPQMHLTSTKPEDMGITKKHTPIDDVASLRVIVRDEDLSYSPSNSFHDHHSNRVFALASVDGGFASQELTC